jgi:tetrahydromethanopterin S-methyltransferase subunit B
MILLQALPTTPGLKEALQYTKDYLVAVIVLFGIGLFIMGIIVYLLWQFTPDIKSFLSVPQQNYNLITIHHRDTAAAIAKIVAIEQNVQAFRDSEKDLLANIREAVAIHSKDCINGHLRMVEVAADVDAIGRSVDKLMTLLTMKRRISDDTGGEK